MLEEEKIKLSKAQRIFNELPNRKRICKDHFQDAIDLEEEGDVMVVDVPSTSAAALIEPEKSGEINLSPPSSDTNQNASPSSDLNTSAPSLSPMSTSESWSSKTFSSDTTGESAEILELDETDPKLLDQHFLIKGSQLLTLFCFCPSCGSKISRSVTSVRLRAVGTAPVVDYICTACSPNQKRFEGQERAVFHPREKSFRGNVQAAVAAITTGTRYVGRNSDLHLAADGSYDSRGYSAEIGKVVIADLCTKLIVHTEVLDRSQCEDLERVGPHGGTAVCETKNALDRLYCRKEVFYPLETYKLYIMLSTLHFNTLRLAERAGTRTTSRVIRYQRKFMARQSTVAIKTAVKHEWRREILAHVLELRGEILRSGATPAHTPIPLHIQQLLNAEDSMADLETQVLRVENLRRGLVDGLQLDITEDPDYSDDNRLLRMAYSIVNYDSGTDSQFSG
ncbi:hypothetical protein GCK32_013789 [Trichostrongylus colubriformis]|uniref:Uncharacterized protein n=1 Tax=Trichostrongylus colubriformis TaxID=6319 RepID=A0AAN8F0Z8_TRICO